MERKQFEGLSQWTFECTVRIKEVVYESLYDYSRNNQPLELDPYPRNVVSQMHDDSDDAHSGYEDLYYSDSDSDEEEEEELVPEFDVDCHVDDHIQSVIDMRNHRYSRNLQSRQKEKEKKMKRNKMVYKRRDGKYNDKRIERKMRKYNGNFKRLLC